MPCVASTGIIDGLSELIEGGGVEKYGSFRFLGGFACGEIEPPLKRSGKPDAGISKVNGFGGINGGAIIDWCHMEVVDTAGLLEPSSITPSLTPL
jgi:hypothetical protein